MLSYFMADDTVSIFEPPLPNTGIVGGKFLERRPVFKPQGREQYTDKDLYVGATVVIHQRGFELIDADEYTFQYLENNRHLYLPADWDLALRATRAQLRGKWRIPSCNLQTWKTALQV